MLLSTVNIILKYRNLLFLYLSPKNKVFTAAMTTLVWHSRFPTGKCIFIKEKKIVIIKQKTKSQN
jgi:hypothetical protein